MQIKFLRSSFALMVLSALAGGCVVKAGGFPFGASAGAPPRSYDGDECDEVRTRLGEPKKEAIKQPTAEQRVLAAACEPRGWSHTTGYGQLTNNKTVLVPAMDLFQTHSTFDDRGMDAVTGALFVIQAANNLRSESGEYIYYDTDMLAKDEADENEGHRAELVLGIAHAYAAMVQPVLEKQLAALDVPADVKSAFVGRFAWSAEHIDGLIAPMTAGKKKIFLDLPLKIHADRVAKFALHTADYAKLDALEIEAMKAKKGGGDASVVGAKITALRSGFLAACGGEECTFDPFYVETTRQLVVLYLLGKQPLLADAEAQVLARKDANRNGFAQQLYAAQKEMVLRAREAFERKSDAKNKGLDSTMTKAVVGDALAMDFEHGMFWEVSNSLPNWASLAESKSVKTDVGAVLSVKTKGTTAMIDFGTEYDTFGEDYNCVKTGRLAAIHDDGTLQWEENCQTAYKKVPRAKPSPIMVPASDASSLKTGERLTFVVDTSTRVAVVVSAQKDEKTTTQLRGDRLAPTSGTPKKSKTAKAKGSSGV